MKKLLLTLGTAASMAAPLATVVACEEEAIDPVATPEEGNQEDDSEGGATPEEDEGVNDALTKPLQIDGADYIPTEDKFIVMDEHYTNGVLWSGDNKTGVEDTASYVDLVRGVQWGADQGVVQIENGDSVIVVYDEDDADGFNVNNFDDSVAFVDTSISWDVDIVNINTSMGHGTASDWGTTISLPRFKDGKLLPYVGGQSNHNDPSLTFQDTLRIISKQLDQVAFDAILAYYGYMDSVDANGDYQKDPSILNGANTAFMPFVAEAGLLSYEKIASNAIKITYNNTNSEFGLPASQFAFIQPIDGQDNMYDTSEFGKFSFGSNSWDVYEGHSTDYTFKARKNIYINA